MRIFMKADTKQQGELGYQQFNALLHDMGLAHFHSVSHTPRATSYTPRSTLHAPR